MRRVFLLVLILVALGGLLWRFPYAVRDENQVHHLLYLLVFLVIIITQSRLITTLSWRRALRGGAAWAGIFVLLVLAYSFRGSLPKRFMGEMMPQQVQVQDDGTLEIHASQGGHFFLEAQVNRVPVRFMVDTGASDIVLAPQDAARAGIAVEALTYDREYNTANGYGSGAKVVLGSLQIGTLTLRDMPASVNKQEMSESLLGMAFLKRLRGFHVDNDTLVLIP